jgi:hypothetical protein
MSFVIALPRLTQVVQGEKYTPLSEVTGSGLFNVTAVVTSVRITEKTRSGGEYFRRAISCLL